MKRFIFSLICALSLSFSALAQTPTQFSNVQVNSQLDVRGTLINGTGALSIPDAVTINSGGGAAELTITTGSLVAGVTLTGPASTTLGASLNLPHGTAPTSPVDGDLWTTTSGLFARINGSTIGPLGAAPTGFALTKTNDTNVTLTLGGTPTTALLQATSLTLGWTGNLSVARGGSGAGTLTGLLQGNGTSAFTAITDSSTTGQVLRVTGASTYGWGALSLSTAAAITGTLPFGNGGTGLSTASDDQTLVSSGSAWVAKTLPDCTDTGGNHINYTQSTNSFSCGTTTGTASPGGSNTQVQFNDSSSFGGDAGLTYNKTTDALTIGSALTVNSVDVTPTEGSDVQAGFSFAAGCSAASGNYELRWFKVGHLVSGYMSLSCTSNGTNWITGVIFPAGIRPTNTLQVPTITTDNSVNATDCGTINILNSGSLVLGKCSSTGGSWTNANSKSAIFTFSYVTNN